MTRKKIFIPAVLAAALCLSACSGGGKTPQAEGKLKIVASIFPEYDWMLNVLGDNPAGADVTLLLDSGVDLHSYQPTAGDIMKISSCDLFVYVGGESDRWVSDALGEAVNKDMTVISLLDVLGGSAREEEAVEGMQDEEPDETSQGSPDADGGTAASAGEAADEKEYDEHVWLSLRNAALFVGSFADELGRLDPDHAALYRDNANAYIEKLSALDREYEKAVSEGEKDTLLFGDRFPFRYLVEDYGLSYYAAFSGCSAETEASFETITFLAKKCDELSLHAIMMIDGSSPGIAETIAASTKTKDQEILALNSLQSTTAKDIEAGASYLSIMEENLEVLRAALK